ncbi:DUF72 domain-containing protein [Flavihumibacter stibioxidans]|uniref:DUF72 domain-containing protein n=1 Tax=Flavihumibacter stibioxidans TaxID=1834163 RepID=A0ABR7M8K5_9BACT|nr:DUF72 domain-containing protein [Flavihumibacter stibioxidans]MBC6491050.1 hypothetical protein [Flavihumibacter stibioxidans]
MPNLKGQPNMEFGQLPESMLDAVDFSLRADPPVNALSLGGKRVAAPRLYLGATRWTQADWVGNLYPPKARPADFLRYYSEQFNCIELNATHYKLYDAEALGKWSGQVAEGRGFLFCPKLYQGISHRGGLKGKESMTRDFAEGLKGLAGEVNSKGSGFLGPVFIQLSESFGPSRQVELLEYLSGLPAGLRWMVEMRHPDWFSKASVTEHVFSALHSMGVGAVITDVAGRRDVCHMQLPVSRTMVRFVGNRLHPTDYSRLDAWARRLADWFDAGLEEAIFILHMGDDGVVPEFARHAARVLSAATGLELPVPVLYESGPSQGSLF